MCILYVHFLANKTNFHKRGFALSLVLKMRVFFAKQGEKTNIFWQVNKLKASWR